MKRIKHLASKIVKDKTRLWKLLTTSIQLSNTKDMGRSMLKQVRLLIEMLQYHLKGEYPGLSGQSLFLLVFALLYFIIPTDLIPDFIPAGLLDDASVILGVSQSLTSDIQAFQEWKNGTNAGVS